MKEEVLDLKEMVNLHIEKSKKELDEKDRVIEALK